MKMNRAEVTDKGLAKRLGEVIILVKGSKFYEGRLGYIPENFAIFNQNNQVIRTIKKGDIIKLRIGSCKANYSEHYRRHSYKK